ncbi:hypothetical protein D3C81_1627450 [compost metagenome]
MGDIQTGHHNRDARLEDNFCGFRIDEDVELCRGRPVPQPHRSTHDHNPRDFGVQFRVAVEQQCHVGLRACCHQRHRLVAVSQHVRHQLNRRAVLRFKARFR